MKTYTLFLLLFMVGCVKAPTTHSQPPVEVVIITPLPLPKTQGRIVEVIEVEEPPVIRHTWMTGEEVKEAKHQRLVKDHPECDCLPGDPLCSCLEE